MWLASSWALYAWVLYIAIALLVSLKTHWSVGPFLFVALLNTADYPHNAYLILVTLLFFVSLPPTLKTVHRLIVLLASVCIVSTGVTFSQAGVEPYYRMGLSGNASMNGSLIAMTFPAYALWCARHLTLLGRVTFTPIPVIAIYMTGASTPIGVLCVAILVYASRSLARVFVPVVAALFTLGFGLQGAEFLSDTGRFSIWRQTLKTWVSEGNLYSGMGTGSVHQYLRLDNVLNNRPRGGFWVHNDWFQILIENGVIGLTAAALLFAFALIKSESRPWLQSSIAAFGACMIFNFPLHMPLHAFTGAALIWLTHAKISNQV